MTNTSSRLRNIDSHVTPTDGESLLITGIAGYISDKASTCCLWIMDTNKFEIGYVIIDSNWKSEYVGRKVTIIGEVWTGRKDSKNMFKQQRAFPEGSYMLRNIRLQDGDIPSFIEVENESADPFFIKEGR